jgi:hypothetical protein
MGQEQQPSPLRHIHVDLESWSVILEGADGRAISFNPNLLLQRLLSPTLTDLPPASDEDTTQAPETNPTVTLVGKLKSQPKEGSVDGSGFPTAWARFAAHEEGARQAHMYIATFHRKTREVALGLKPENQIIIEGYPHDRSRDGKADTFSVIHIIDYPGKPASQKDGN